MILDIVRQHSQLSGNATMEEFGMRLELDPNTGFMRVSIPSGRLTVSTITLLCEWRFMRVSDSVIPAPLIITTTVLMWVRGCVIPL